VPKGDDLAKGESAVLAALSSCSRITFGKNPWRFDPFMDQPGVSISSNGKGDEAGIG